MADKIILVYAARHGTTALNQAGKFRGKSDVELDAQGMKDARMLAYYFKPIELSHIISSDKKRARQTAHTIAGVKEMPVHVTENLRPWNVGEFSGKPKDRENTKALQAFINDPDREIPGGESLNEFKSRIRPCLREAVELAQQAGEPVLLVVHSSDIHEIGSMFYDNHEAILVEPGGVVAIYIADGQLGAEGIFKTRKPGKKDRHADTIS